MNIRDRIKELRRVPASELRPSPHNWRTHPRAQLDALKGVLAEIGYAGAALARELEDGSLELIDGHARAEVSGDSPVPVLVLDVTADEAKKILATFDPLGAMAESDAAKLDALLREVQTESQAVGDMLTRLVEKSGVIPAGGTTDVAEIYQGMPEFENENQLGKYKIIVHFDEFEDVRDFGRLIGQKLTEKTKSIWHPWREELKQSEYLAEDDGGDEVEFEVENDGP